MWWRAHYCPTGKRRSSVEHRGPFMSELVRYPGKGGWTFALIPQRLAPPVTRPWGRTPVRAVVDGVSWNTSIWRDKKSNGAFLAVPARVRGRKGSGEAVRVEFTFDPEEDDA
jgi:hypothetical protein